MRLVFGVLGLVVVLAIVGSLLRKQLQTVQRPLAPAVGASAAALSGTPAQQSQSLQKKVADDVNRFMQQAPKRLEGAEQ